MNTEQKIEAGLKETIAKKHIQKYYQHKGKQVSLDDILPMSRIYPMMDEYAQEVNRKGLEREKELEEALRKVRDCNIPYDAKNLIDFALNK